MVESRSTADLRSFSAAMTRKDRRKAVAEKLMAKPYYLAAVADVRESEYLVGGGVEGGKVER